MSGVVTLDSSGLPVTPKSPAMMIGSPPTKSPSDERIGRFECRSDAKKTARSAPSPTLRRIGEVGAEVGERVVEGRGVSVVVLLALEEGKELRQLGAAAVVGRRRERPGVEGDDRKEQAGRRADDANRGDPERGEAKAAPARAEQPEDERHEKSGPEREREAPDHSAPGRALQVTPRGVDGRALPAGRLERAPAVERADLGPELERRVERVRPDSPVGDRDVGVDLAERVGAHLEGDPAELGVRLGRPRYPPARHHRGDGQRGGGQDAGGPGGDPAGGGGTVLHRRDSDAASG